MTLIRNAPGGGTGPPTEDASVSNGKLYETDFYGWTQQQARLLRSRRLAELDIENILEEIETLGRSERSTLRSAYRLIALHLLKQIYQPEKRSQSWTATIVRERGNVVETLEENPGLRPQREALFLRAYASARKDAMGETGLPSKTFPSQAPFSVDDAENETFFATEPVRPDSDA